MCFTCPLFLCAKHRKKPSKCIEKNIPLFLKKHWTFLKKHWTFSKIPRDVFFKTTVCFLNRYNAPVFAANKLRKRHIISVLENQKSLFNTQRRFKQAFLII